MTQRTGCRHREEKMHKKPIKEIEYRRFSWKTHRKNWSLKKSSVCQFELTFGCGLHCRHCYTDCYNKRPYLKKELGTNEVKSLLDKISRAGILWLCLTGGDPLTKRDFPDIYSYAKNKGFLITLFTNGYSMTPEIAGLLKRRPPFAIETTLNAATEDLYEKISGIKGSYAKALKGISMVLKALLPLKIKTQVTADNFSELPRIKNFIESMGLKFHPSVDLYARLNGDTAPCKLRIPAQEALNLNGRRPTENECRLSRKDQDTGLFNCTISGGDGIYIDPYGNLLPCQLIREPAFDLLGRDIEYARSRVLEYLESLGFASGSKCNGCDLRPACHWCPGRAYVETGRVDAPVGYYCGLAKAWKRSI